MRLYVRLDEIAFEGQNIHVVTDDFEKAKTLPSEDGDLIDSYTWIYVYEDARLIEKWHYDGGDESWNSWDKW